MPPVHVKISKEHNNCNSLLEITSLALVWDLQSRSARLWLLFFRLLLSFSLFTSVWSRSTWKKIVRIQSFNSGRHACMRLTFVQPTVNTPHRATRVLRIVMCQCETKTVFGKQKTAKMFDVSEKKIRTFGWLNELPRSDTSDGRAHKKV